MPSLFDNTTAPPASSGQFPQSYELGVGFRMSTPAAITGLRWRSMNSQTLDRPQTLRLWDGVTQSVVAGPVIAPHSGSVGWQSVALTSAFTPVANHRYVVSMGIDGYTTVGAYAAPNDPPAPLIFDAPQSIQSQSAGMGSFPANVSTSTWAVDIVTGVPSGPDPGTGGAGTGDPALTGDLGSWLSNTTPPQLHQSDGIPYWLYEYLLSLRPWLGEAADWSAKLPVPINWLAGTLMQRYVTDIDTITSYVGKTANWISPLPAPGRNNTIDERLERIEAKIDAIQAALTELAAPPPPLSWTLVGEQAFDTWAYMPVPANYYLVHFDDTGAATVMGTPVGIEYIPRLAWWTPHDGTGGRERSFIDLRDSYCGDRGAMMPGLLLHAPHGGGGTIQAYTT